jgi:hypothetical protein
MRADTRKRVIGDSRHIVANLFGAFALFLFLRDAEVQENSVFPFFVPVAVADKY